MRVITVCGCIVAVAGAIGPQVSTLSPKWGAIIAILGTAAAACGNSLIQGNPRKIDYR